MSWGDKRHIPSAEDIVKACGKDCVKTLIIEIN